MWDTWNKSTPSKKSFAIKHTRFRGLNIRTGGFSWKIKFFCDIDYEMSRWKMAISWEFRANLALLHNSHRGRYIEAVWHVECYPLLDDLESPTVVADVHRRLASVDNSGLDEPNHVCSQARVTRGFWTRACFVTRRRSARNSILARNKKAEAAGR